MRENYQRASARQTDHREVSASRAAAERHETLHNLKRETKEEQHLPQRPFVTWDEVVARERRIAHPETVFSIVCSRGYQCPSVDSA
jgi:hypothetical protein